MVEPPVIAVVGRSGSGKTTLLTKLVPALRSRGLRVGVVKHHGHSTPFDTPGKDTYRLSEAGADVVVGVSSVQVAMFSPRDAGDWSTQVAPLLAEADIVLAEGFSQSLLPKIEVHRSDRSDSLLSKPDELLALVSDDDWPFDIPIVPHDHVDVLVEVLLLGVGVIDSPTAAGIATPPRSGPEDRVSKPVALHPGDDS